MIVPVPLATVLPESVSFYLAMMLVGFLIGGYGHLAKSRLLIILGVLLIFLATLVLPVAIVLTDESPSPGPNIQSP